MKWLVELLIAASALALFVLAAAVHSWLALPLVVAGAIAVLGLAVYELLMLIGLIRAVRAAHRANRPLLKGLTWQR
jgi:hypothetical protein